MLIFFEKHATFHDGSLLMIFQTVQPKLIRNADFGYLQIVSILGIQNTVEPRNSGKFGHPEFFR